MRLCKQGRDILARCRPLVDAEIGRVLAGRDDIALYEMLRYHLGSAEAGEGHAPGFAGKRVRGTVCLLSCEAAGATAESAGPAAAAIELLHSFTLLHDDIADQDEVRRGRQTVWRRWGIGQAITAGDALFALANLAVSRPQRAGVSADTVSGVLRELNEATLAVCEGQQLDLSYEGRADVGIEGYLAMIERKTAALFAAAAAIGAQVADAPTDKQEGLRAFGHHLGLGYQIRDDILGIWGDPKEMGKPAGSDLRRNKRSLPIVHALGARSAEEGKAFADRLSRGLATDEEAAAVAGEMEEMGSRAFCERMAGESLERALQVLEDAGLCGEPAAPLRTLASYLMERTQ
ncbi:MAG: polyprenyl synthetase family protein [Armatimonadota bacterium]|nr:polyprenyl synthetase family protein [Armatimonadota bacterium]